MAKKKGQKSKDRIIEVNLKLIYQKGYADTAAQEIADICGVSQANVFYHFKSKKKLFLETLNFVIENNRRIFAQMVSDDTPPNEQLKKLLISNIKWAVEYPEQTNIILILFNFATFDHEFRELADKTIKNGQELVLDILQETKPKEGKISNKIKARMIQQYVNGIMFQILASSRPHDVADEFEANLDHFIESL